MKSFLDMAREFWWIRSGLWTSGGKSQISHLESLTHTVNFSYWSYHKLFLALNFFITIKNYIYLVTFRSKDFLTGLYSWKVIRMSTHNWQYLNCFWLTIVRLSSRASYYGLFVILIFQLLFFFIDVHRLRYWEIISVFYIEISCFQ